MKAAKIISFIAFILNSCLSINFFFFSQNFQEIFEYLDKQTPFPWPSLIYLAFALISIIYWFYLRKKTKEGKNIRYALLISLVLLLIPELFMVLITYFSFMLPIYEGVESF